MHAHTHTHTHMHAHTHAHTHTCTELTLECIIFDRNHHVYFDNFFSSVDLLCDLYRVGLYGCGTLRSNRRGFPEAFKPYIKKGLKERGDQMVRQDGQLTAYLWQDNKAVTVIATNANPNEKSSVNRKLRDGSTTPFSCPMAIVLYNQLMGGVDNNDQLRGYNNIRTKGRKFYKYIGWFLTDIAITNSYILARITPTSTFEASQTSECSWQRSS